MVADQGSIRDTGIGKQGGNSLATTHGPFLMRLPTVSAFVPLVASCFREEKEPLRIS
ncbi:hypothetical protein [Caulobacter sp. BE254]|uniref:hypothetical protein n=1 Tax=Caulobacter sp. BE254 TaxID=2817720 RepID=UPI00285EB950|nr:hypothetical protein [Caulobacter sp. BE254]MDR7114515.1 hypothetical protein [Caulobacter sp. BE254]